MSTPSTAAVLPPPYPHYSSHHNHLLGSHPHLTNGHSYSSSSTSNGTITNGINPHQVSLPASTMASRGAQAPHLDGGRPRKQPVDWSEYYKNGIPQEIIVIDDTESPPPSSNTKRTTLTTSRIAPSSQLSTGAARHADKKRRTTNTSTYDQIYPGPVYSATHTPLGIGHGSPTVTASSSTAGRNSSTLISTAATSAGSSGIGPSAAVAYPAGNAGSGTKRKRMTRSTVAAAVAAASGDVYGGYHPPPKPPIKAKEVFVQTIADVCFLTHSGHVLQL